MYRRMREGKADTVSLTQDRIRRLEEIGFEWSVRGGKLSPWELRFNDLVNFKRRFKHCRVPENWEENQELGIWVKDQRLEAKRLRVGHTSRLTEEQLTRLTNIGFEWEGDQPQSVSRALSNTGAGSMADTAQLQLRRHFAPSHQHAASLAPYLPTPSTTNQLLQAQLDLLLTQNRVLPPSIPGYLAASEATAEASRREGLLRHVLAGRVESQNLSSGSFVSSASFGPPSASSNLSALATQNTLLERMMVQQALQDIHGLSSVSQSTQHLLPFASRSQSLHNALQFDPSNQLQSSLLSARTTANLLHQASGTRSSMGPTSRTGDASTLYATGASRGFERNEALGDDADKDEQRGRRGGA